MTGHVKLLTLVSNAGGVGPGHSAISINDIVHTFEVPPHQTIGPGTGWDKFKMGDYLRRNAHRPVYIQTLKTEVDPGRTYSYVVNSTDDYGINGVCSQQVALAVDHGWMLGTFDPVGIDTPYKVYHHARRKRLVQSESRVWPGRDSLPVGVRAALEAVIFFNM